MGALGRSLLDVEQLGEVVERGSGAGKQPHAGPVVGVGEGACPQTAGVIHIDGLGPSVARR